MGLVAGGVGGGRGVNGLSQCNREHVLPQYAILNPTNCQVIFCCFFFCLFVFFSLLLPALLH